MVAAVADLGVRRPACLLVPPGRAGSFGDDVAELADRLGRAPELEQRLAIDALVAHDAGKRFLSLEAALEMPRQNGKTSHVLLPIALWTALTDPDEMTWSAHMYESSLREFRALVDPDHGLLVNFDWLRRRVRSVSEKDNDESVTFVNGAVLNFRCRSGRRSRGLSGSTLFLDEWLFGTAAMVGAALPTVATRSQAGTARAYYASSAPKAASAHLRSLRRRALAGDPTLTYCGWWARGSWADPGCAQDGCRHGVDTEGCALDDEDRWAEGNILLDRRISREYLRTTRRTLADDPIEFGREHMGWGEDGDDAVDVDFWSTLTDPHSAPAPSPVGLGVAVSPGGRTAAVVAAGYRPDGLVHVELLALEPGTAWLAGWCSARQVTVDAPVHYLAGKRVPETPVVPALTAAGVRLEPVAESDFPAACDDWDRRFRGGQLRHRGDPRLSAALGAVVRKDVGEGAWVMTWRGSKGDAAPARAMVLAVRALVTEPERPGQILF